jgi:hypothetical protein
MRNQIMLIGCAGLLFSCALLAADPAYVGTWKVNDAKTDLGIAMTFEPADAGDLRMFEGGRTHIIRFDGKDYPHPLGGVSRWMRIDDHTWETTYSKDGKVLGNAIYQLSADGQTLTRRSKGDTGEVPYRRRSGEPEGLAGAWSLTAASVPGMTIEVTEGYDLVVTSGGAKCKANFDGRDYPIIEPNGKAAAFEACRITKVSARSFSMIVTLNGKPVGASTVYSVSEDGRTLTQPSGPVGQPPTSTIVYDRQ